MKAVIFGLIVLILAIGLELLTHDDSGYLVIGYGQWMIETTLTLAVIVLGLIFIGGYLALRFVSHIGKAPRRLGESRQRRRSSRASKMLIEGLIDIEEGNWDRAERALVKDIAYSNTPLLNYIAAARSAQNQGAYERRDHYLHLAREAVPAATFAIELIQAELQVNSGQFEEALAILNHLRTLDPRHPQPLKLLKSLYLQQRDWDQLLGLLLQLCKRRLVSKEEAHSLEVMAHVELLQEAAQSESNAALIDRWKAVPNRFRKHPKIVAAYVYALIDRNEHDLAEQLLQDTLKGNWSDELIYLYGLVQSSDLVAQLTRAEAWLSQQGDNPWLLLTLGRLAQYNGLWGKARQYLETSIAYAPRSEAYHELGKVLEEIGDSEAALECYSKGLSMATRGAVEESVKFSLPEKAREISLSGSDYTPQLTGPAP
ncbi:HemY-like protein [Nitrosococcus oceani ATCC 19707]|uniref:HemY-like protein n=2 Tax=Nitrosococcus oceani TaxID=1229 RepID=Q3JDR8_NITOC|nr:heme biosynthesis protein HemY [Nitrosococcus oceani]ABA57028.1 HemY-like protein [Nitrosococcus oceani ATCC 19707]EDZ65462.1 HemY N-terminal domain protein [Nitrosococcus oceani AFC27]KFI20498.1 heme biosynthesis protein HemY [Nitrosococcus oceani C-27]GEM19959.1 heme biosynthesis protein HemY [Nitrosococcus oceani]